MADHGSLAVDRMTDAGLWKRLDRDLRELENYAPGQRGQRPRATVLAELRLVAGELRLRGTQGLLFDVEPLRAPQSGA